MNSTAEIVIDPPKKGTEKQISWATSIIRDFTARYQVALATMTEVQLKDLKKQSASFWITNRNKKGLTFVKCFVDRKSIKENRRARFARSVAGMTRADNPDRKVGDRVKFDNAVKARMTGIRLGTVTSVCGSYGIGVKWDDSESSEMVFTGYLIEV